MMSEFKTIQKFHGFDREYIAIHDGKTRHPENDWAGVSYKYVADNGEVREGRNMNVREKLYGLMVGA